MKIIVQEQCVLGSLLLLLGGFCVLPSAVYGEESSEGLKERVEYLELELQKLKSDDNRSDLENTPAGDAASDLLDERFGSLSLHGGIVSLYQGGSFGKVNGQNYNDPGAFGYALDLEASFEPTEGGSVYIRAHTGQGDGADRDIEGDGLLFADLNTINDDNPSDSALKVLDAYYSQAFLDGELALTIGKTEPLAFIDDNEFANNEAWQFIGKALVNNPVIDGEDEYAPLVAVVYSPIAQVSFSVLVQSSSYPTLAEEEQKDVYSDVFDSPFIGGQLTFTTGDADAIGNYRLYAWTQTYEHERLNGEGTDSGWGLGVSADEQLGESVGVFLAAYNNEDVYKVPVFLSTGVNLRGLVDGREDDEFAVGMAALLANDDLEDSDTEWHFESYYLVNINPNFAFGPHIQLALDPLGNSDNDEMIVGSMRAVAGF